MACGAVLNDVPELVVWVGVLSSLKAAISSRANVVLPLLHNLEVRFRDDP